MTACSRSGFHNSRFIIPPTFYIFCLICCYFTFVFFRIPCRFVHNFARKIFRLIDRINYSKITSNITQCGKIFPIYCRFYINIETVTFGNDINQFRYPLPVSERVRRIPVQFGAIPLESSLRL